MNRKRDIIIVSAIIALGCSLAFLASCRKKPQEGMVIFTLVSGELQDLNTAEAGDAGQNILPGIAALYPDNPDSQPVVLTQGFYAARSPEISCDGTRMLFTARKKQDDLWQIWEMDLKKSKFRQVATLSENCFYPAYLPNGRVIFTREVLMNNPGSGLTVFSCNPDGSDVRQVTFNPCSYSSLTVLRDGRVLAVCRQLDTDDKKAVIMILRPDGTKNMLFYEVAEGSDVNSRGFEISDGRIAFIESVKGNTDGGHLMAIRYNRPLHSYTILSSGIGGSFRSVFPLKSGKFLVSYRKSESDRYGLHEFDPENKTLGRAIWESREFNVSEAVAVEKHERPKKLPSEVDMGVKTGLLLCQDVNFHNIDTSRSEAIIKVNKIRIIGKDSTLGVIDVEKDGSFYLKVIADTPFKIQTIDDKGNTTGNSCRWLYLRPNERRGCIGCHEDPELVPENKVSMAVKHAPVNIPVHISKVVEKKVSLE